MTNLSKQFLNIEKKVRQMCVVKMQEKMDHAAEMTMKHADKSRNFKDITGNLYKSIAVGTYYKGELQSEHYAPGPEPTRRTLAVGEPYTLTHFYRASWPWRQQYYRAYRGEYGDGGQSGPEEAENELIYREHGRSSRHATWQLLLVAGVDYAKYVEVKGGHDVISSLRSYMVRYFRKM